MEKAANEYRYERDMIMLDYHTDPDYHTPRSIGGSP